jgi:hypothetical protein
MKHPYLILVSAFALAFTASAPAEIVSFKSKVANQPDVVQTYLSTFNPTVSVIEASQTPRTQFKKNAAAVLLAGPLFLPATTSASSGTKGKSSNKKGTVNAIVAPAILNDPLTPTPEPAAESLVLMGLFGAGLWFVRRKQSLQS